ncbi:MAG: recombinase family protein [Clostridia bacterium]|nr:recombinase family protein [Clostridia bacterium]
MKVDIDYKIPKGKKAGTRAVVYARYSSHSQTDQSIEGQLSEAHKYAAARGYKIIHEYCDYAKTGRNDNREQFQKMLKDTEKRQFDVIILWKVDRFGRNREEIAINKYRCKKNGVRVEYVAEQIPNTPEGVILESVLEGFAEYYSLQLSQNVRRGRLESAKKCQSVGGNILLGYKIDENKKYVINEETAPIVRMIYSSILEGNSISQTVQKLNESGYRRSNGKEFTFNSLQPILHNRRYTGIYIYEDLEIEGGIPQLIDEETFYNVQKILEKNKKNHRYKTTDYLLTGKAFCGKCGAKLVGDCGTARNGTVHYYYSCPNKKKKEKSCDLRSVRQDILEEIVLEKTFEMLRDDELLELIIDGTWELYQTQDSDSSELDNLKSQLKQVNAAIGNLIKAVELGIFNEETKQRMDELKAQQEDLTRSIAEQEALQTIKLTRNHISYFLYKLRDLDYSDKENCKKLIDCLINAVYINDDDTCYIMFNYKPDTATVCLKNTQKVKENTIKSVRTAIDTLHHGKIGRTIFVNILQKYVRDML